ncbi:MAG: hypothetical protein AAGA56_26775 [Myxococcota bacterium]
MEVCEEAPSESLGEASRACQERHLQMVFGRLAERYSLVSHEQLQRHCDAYPRDCRKTTRLERWMRKSHNKEVERRYQEELREARLEHRDRSRAAFARDEQVADRKRREEAHRTNIVNALIDWSISDRECVTREVSDTQRITNCRDLR